eukprot:g29597.t1
MSYEATGKKDEVFQEGYEGSQFPVGRQRTLVEDRSQEQEGDGNADAFVNSNPGTWAGGTFMVPTDCLTSPWLQSRGVPFSAPTLPEAPGRRRSDSPADWPRGLGGRGKAGTVIGGVAKETPVGRKRPEPDLLGAFVCRLCQGEYPDSLALARHGCPGIAREDHRCSDCGKVFGCPANLASHRRWHQPRRHGTAQQRRAEPNVGAARAKDRGRVSG